MADTDTALPAERWLAPAHASGVTLSTGPVAVVDGEIEIPGETSVGDRGGLYANGFRPAAPDAPVALAPASSPITPPPPPAGEPASE